MLIKEIPSYIDMLKNTLSYNCDMELFEPDIRCTPVLSHGFQNILEDCCSLEIDGFRNLDINKIVTPFTFGVVNTLKVDRNVYKDNIIQIELYNDSIEAVKCTLANYIITEQYKLLRFENLPLFKNLTDDCKDSSEVDTVKDLVESFKVAVEKVSSYRENSLFVVLNELNNPIFKSIVNMVSSIIDNKRYDFNFDGLRGDSGYYTVDEFKELLNNNGSFKYLVKSISVIKYDDSEDNSKIYNIQSSDRCCVELCYLFNFRCLNGYRGLFEDRVFRPFSYRKILDVLNLRFNNVSDESKLYHTIELVLKSYYDTDNLELENYMDLVISGLLKELLKLDEYIENKDSIYKILITKVAKGD